MQSTNQSRSGKIELEEILGEELSRAEAEKMLEIDYDTYRTYQSFRTEEKEKILRFIQGQRGLPITYDTFFKKIMSPKEHPERIESLLSVILGQEVYIEEVLEREGTHMLDAGSFVVMDILLSLEDGSYMNVEMQKIGYEFPGERSCCYLSDMTMRQYNLLKSQKQSEFKYSDMKPVFLIVLMEKSSEGFARVAPNYQHKMEISYNSQGKVESLFNVMYISLDTYRRLGQNISTKLDAWLTFLSSEEPQDIVRLVTQHPEFGEYYQDIVEFRRNPKELIGMFSDALRMMDHNTERYMVNELQRDVDELRQTVKEQGDTIKEQGDTIKEKDGTINEQAKMIQQMEARIKQLEKTLQEKTE